MKTELDLDLLEAIHSQLGVALDLAHDRDYWKSEAEQWRKMYTDLLNESIKNSEVTTGNMLTLLIGKEFTTTPERKGF